LSHKQRVTILIQIVTILTILVQAILIGEFRISDSIEYAVIAQRVKAGEGTTFILNNFYYPSRFTPWFSTIFLAPATIITSDLRISGSIILIFSLAALRASQIIGSMIDKENGANMATLMLLLNSGFLYFSGNIMTEIPAYYLLTLNIILWLQPSSQSSTQLAILSGIISTLAIAVRPTLAPLLLLHVLRNKNNFKNILLVLLPTITLFIGNIVYNYNVFGSPTRTGYHAWMSVPYDHLLTTFNITYIVHNLPLGTEIISLLVFGVCFILAAKWNTSPNKTPIQANHIFTKAMLCLLVITIPTLIFYLLYFYGTNRFYWPYEQFAIVIIASYISFLISHHQPQNTLKLATLYGYIAITIGIYQINHTLKTPRTLQKHLLNLSSIHDQQQLSTQLNPLLVQYYHPKKTIIPYDRRAEYASKCFTPRKPTTVLPQPLDPLLHRHPKLLGKGCYDVFPIVQKEISS
jgi:hypothetical protein